MKRMELIERFAQLRAQGKSFAAIAAEIGVSKPTLITWSRKHFFKIQNLLAIETEAIVEQTLPSPRQCCDQLASHLRQVEQELAQRKLESVPTARLISLAAQLRKEAAGLSRPLRFSCSADELPSDHGFQNVMDWEI